MKQPTVTIMLTIRNNDHTVEKCMDSLLKQNYNHMLDF